MSSPRHCQTNRKRTLLASDIGPKPKNLISE
jgi:hypothetical protein